MSRSASSAGFTLVEVVVSLAVLGLVLASALSAAAADLRASRRAIATSEAAALAEDLLFRAPFLSWDSLTAFGAQREGRFAAPLDRYRWRIDTEPAGDEPALLDAVVTVAWTDGAVTVATRLAPPAASQAEREP